jgi:prepilin-type N-terminal cleavage/methylation domain-containing protein
MARHHSHRGRRLDGGFTIVEILVVVIVLGILASVTVFAIRGISDRGKQVSCATDRTTLESALDTYSATPQGVLASGRLTEADLVNAGFLVEPSGFYDVVNGTIVPTAGNVGGCS